MVDLEDESAGGLERSGPHTDANIMKNSTVMTSDSTTSVPPNVENKTTAYPASVSAGSAHIRTDSLGPHTESSAPTHVDDAAAESGGGGGAMMISTKP